MKKCLVIVNSYNEDACKLSEKIENFLKEKQICSEKILYSGQKSVFSGYNKDVYVDLDQVICAITLGGDGTVLFAARFCSLHDIPIFPINLGQFGFIAGIQPDKWQKSFEEFLDGTISIVQRSMVKVELYREQEKIFYSNALNDIAITERGAARIIFLEVTCNGNALGTLKSDGVVVATATGSTAYSAAAGGPILDPELDALIFNPICSFSLSTRSLVLPFWAEIYIKVLPSRDADVCITCDGQVSFDSMVWDEIRICKEQKSVSLIGCDSSVFYGALRSKFNWSGGSLA